MDTLNNTSILQSTQNIAFLVKLPLLDEVKLADRVDVYACSSVNLILFAAIGYTRKQDHTEAESLASMVPFHALSAC